jgi:AcrR family transcriptional regulator
MTQLPRGRHGLSREYIAEHQRARLFAAVAVVLAGKGYAGTTVSAVTGEAGISKSDFYSQFESKDDCILAAYDAAVARVRAEVLVASGTREDWAQRVCAGLAAGLAALAASPADANLLLVEGLCAGPDVCDRFGRAVESFVLYLREGAPRPAVAGPAAVATEEAVVGGIASLVGRRILAGEGARLGRFFPELAEFALSPYLGVAGARRIISAG